jgi:cytidine deaminase
MSIEPITRDLAFAAQPYARALLEAALAAQTRAYAPYSGYQVGCALLGESGRIYVGCNVENASFGATICAERGALMSAIVAGERAFRACLTVSPTKICGSSCGLCRQMLFEFGPDMMIFNASSLSEWVRVSSLAELLPAGFGPQLLKPKSPAADRSA